MKNLSDFVASKVSMTPATYETVHGDDVEGALKVFVYGNCFHIELIEGNQYSLTVNRDNYISTDLSELEAILWDEFVKLETLTQEEILKDINFRIKCFLDSIGKNYKSLLDQISEEALDDFQKKRLKYLLKQIEDCNNTFNPLLPTYYKRDGVKEMRDNLINYFN